MGRYGRYEEVLGVLLSWRSAALASLQIFMSKKKRDRLWVRLCWVFQAVAFFLLPCPRVLPHSLKCGDSSGSILKCLESWCALFGAFSDLCQIDSWVVWVLSLPSLPFQANVSWWSAKDTTFLGWKSLSEVVVPGSILPLPTGHKRWPIWLLHFPCLVGTHWLLPHSYRQRPV